MFADERKPSAAAFLDHAARYYRDLGVRVRCIMTDNAKVFRSLSISVFCFTFRGEPIGWEVSNTAWHAAIAKAGKSAVVTKT